MIETPLQIDGKLHFILETEFPIVNVAFVPNKVINVLTDAHRTPWSLRYRIERWTDEAGIQHKRLVDADTGETLDLSQFKG